MTALSSLALLLGASGQSSVALPAESSFAFTGLPVFHTSADKLLIRNHSVTMELGKEAMSLSSVTEVRNLTSAPMTITVRIPRRQAKRGEGDVVPSFGVRATWNREALALRAERSAPLVRAANPAQSGGDLTRIGRIIESDLVGTVTLAANSTYGLRLEAQIPLGTADLDAKRRATGYLLAGEIPFGQLNLTYRYPVNTVFRLPEAFPALDWQIGQTGVFRRLSNFKPSGELTHLLYYPYGFEAKE